MRIAIVHDYLNQHGGAERVVSVLHEMFPDAPIYTLFYDAERLWSGLSKADIRPSILQRFPFVKRHFKVFFWLYPWIMLTLRVEPCDVIISSSSAYAKSVRVRTQHGSRPVHICYCHTPMRFAWSFDHYIQHETKNPLLAGITKLAVPFLKAWDVWTSRGVDAFVVNSSAVQRRVQHYYKRDAVIIPPPVDTTMSSVAPVSGPDLVQNGYYLVVSRLIGYKGIDLVIRACNQLGRALIIIGRGPDQPRLEAMAGHTITFLGWQEDATVRNYMQNCVALVVPGEEDFGITPVEANAQGKPVVALRRGGSLDTVKEGVNGVFFREPTVASICEALHRCEETTWDPVVIRNVSHNFDTKRFKHRFATFVDVTVQHHGLQPIHVHPSERSVSP